MPITPNGQLQPIIDAADAICNNPSTLAYAAVAANAAFETSKLVYKVVSAQNGTIITMTGYQYLKASEEKLDETLKILNDKVQGGAIKPYDHTTSVIGHNRLREEWYDLEERTSSFIGSARNLFSGRGHYKSSCALNNNVKSLSKKGLVKLAADKAMQGHQKSTPVEHNQSVEDTLSDDSELAEQGDQWSTEPVLRIPSPVGPESH